MDKFASYLKKLDITQNVTEEEVEKTEMLLHVYAPTLRSAAHRLDELGEECYEGRRQTISISSIWQSTMIGIVIGNGLQSDSPTWAIPWNCSLSWSLPFS